MEKAPSWAKVEFTPQEVYNVVEAGISLIKNNQIVKAYCTRGIVKIDNILFLIRFGLSMFFPQTLTINREIFPYVPQQSAMEEVRSPILV